jgi:hypothetical protein
MQIHAYYIHLTQSNMSGSTNGQKNLDMNRDTRLVKEKDKRNQLRLKAIQMQWLFGSCTLLTESQLLLYKAVLEAI